MTGPEHYREAERALAQADTTASYEVTRRAELFAQAQVHATLALAAATALDGTRMPRPDRDAWVAAAGTAPPGSADQRWWTNIPAGRSARGGR